MDASKQHGTPVPPNPSESGAHSTGSRSASQPDIQGVQSLSLSVASTGAPAAGVSPHTSGTATPAPSFVSKLSLHGGLARQPSTASAVPASPTPQVGSSVLPNVSHALPPDTASVSASEAGETPSVSSGTPVPVTAAGSAAVPATTTCSTAEVGVTVPVTLSSSSSTVGSSGLTTIDTKAAPVSTLVEPESSPSVTSEPGLSAVTFKALKEQLKALKKQIKEEKELRKAAEKAAAKKYAAERAAAGAITPEQTLSELVPSPRSAVDEDEDDDLLAGEGVGEKKKKKKNKDKKEKKKKNKVERGSNSNKVADGTPEEESKRKSKHDEDDGDNEDDDDMYVVDSEDELGEKQVVAAAAPGAEPAPAPSIVSTTRTVRPGQVDFSTIKSKRKRNELYERELARLQIELVKLQAWIKHKGLRVVVIFEGRDAAGKGGVIKRITERLNPRICRVVALGTPTEREKTQWYFQRYVAQLPAAGEMVLFDRSWYNRAGVERVMGFCTEEEYQEFLYSCPIFEDMLIRSGILLIKYWFSVSDDVQEKRFQGRIAEPTKRWKLSPMDVESRDKWVEYSKAKDEMLRHTDTDSAPWYHVHADSKKLARLNCISHLLSVIPYQDLTPQAIILPPRKHCQDYVRPPMTSMKWVPDKYIE